MLEEITHAMNTCTYTVRRNVDLSVYPNVSNNDNSTCDVISGPAITYIELAWQFPALGSEVNRFRVVLSGNQMCTDENIVWFVSSEEKTDSSQCELIQNSAGELKECQITCICLCADCKYFHVRAETPAWMEWTLAVCHLNCSINMTQWD